MHTTSRDAHGNILGTTGPISWLGTLTSYVDVIGGGWYRLTLADGRTTIVTRDEFAVHAVSI